MCASSVAAQCGRVQADGQGQYGKHSSLMPLAGDPQMAMVELCAFLVLRLAVRYHSHDLEPRSDVEDGVEQTR